MIYNKKNHCLYVLDRPGLAHRRNVLQGGGVVSLDLNEWLDLSFWVCSSYLGSSVCILLAKLEHRGTDRINNVQLEYSKSIRP